MIEAARKYVTDCEFHIASAEKIPFKDDAFNMSFFGVVFHEVDEFRITRGCLKTIMPDLSRNLNV